MKYVKLIFLLSGIIIGCSGLLFSISEYYPINEKLLSVVSILFMSAGFPFVISLATLVFSNNFTKSLELVLQGKNITNNKKI